MTREIVVSPEFEAMGQKMRSLDLKTGSTFVAQLNLQEAAKEKYQNTTGKIHGFNADWAKVWGVSPDTVKKYSVIAKKTIELRKKENTFSFSEVSAHVLMAYASASPEAQELVEHELEQGRPVTTKQVREIDSGVQDVLEATNLPEREERMRKLSNHVSMPKNYNYTMNISVLMSTADSFASEEGLADIDAEELAGLLYRKMMFIQGKESNPVHMSMYRESLDNMEQMVNRLAEAITLLRSDSLIHSVN
jgi:hypothetical protein